MADVIDFAAYQKKQKRALVVKKERKTKFERQLATYHQISEAFLKSLDDAEVFVWNAILDWHHDSPTISLALLNNYAWKDKQKAIEVFSQFQTLHDDEFD